MAVPLQDDGNGGEMEFEQGALDDPPDEGTLPGEGDGGIYKGRFGSRTYTYTEPSNSYPQNRDMVSALSVLFSEILLLAADYGLPESAVERLLDIIANLKPDLHPDFARNIPDNFRAMLAAMGWGMAILLLIGRTSGGGTEVLLLLHACSTPVVSAVTGKSWQLRDQLIRMMVTWDRDCSSVLLGWVAAGSGATMLYVMMV